MQSRVEQGYWAAIVYYMHKGFFDNEGKRDSTIRFMYLGQIFSAVARSLRFLFRYGPGDLMFEVVTGFAWRWGGFKARGRRDEFKDADVARAKEVSR